MWVFVEAKNYVKLVTIEADGSRKAAASLLAGTKEEKAQECEGDGCFNRNSP